MTARAESIKIPMVCGWNAYLEVDECGYLNMVITHTSGEIVRAMTSEGYENEDAGFHARLGTESEIQQHRKSKRSKK